MSGLSLCQKCASCQRTCCEAREPHVTWGDRQRIAAYTGRTDFFELRHASAHYLPEEDDPAWQRVFLPDGSRPVLRRHHDPQGSHCVFLGAQGCALPLEVRPLICRIYPFDYTATGLRDELAHMCPTWLLAPGQGLLEALCIARADAERWRAQLYSEIGVESFSAVPSAALTTQQPLRPV